VLVWGASSGRPGRALRVPLTTAKLAQLDAVTLIVCDWVSWLKLLEVRRGNHIAQNCLLYLGREANETMPKFRLPLSPTPFILTPRILPATFPYPINSSLRLPSCIKGRHSCRHHRMSTLAGTTPLLITVPQTTHSRLSLPSIFPTALWDLLETISDRSVVIRERAKQEAETLVDRGAYTGWCGIVALPILIVHSSHAMNPVSYTSTRYEDNT
jgi:hypothetical protein